MLVFLDSVMKAMGSTNRAPDVMASMLAGITKNAFENRLIPSIILREITGNAKTLPEEGMRKQQLRYVTCARWSESSLS